MIVLPLTLPCMMCVSVALSFVARPMLSVVQKSDVGPLRVVASCLVVVQGVHIKTGKQIKTLVVR